MDLIKFYGNYIKSLVVHDKPEAARKLIELGLSLEEQRTKFFPYKEAPESLKFLNQISIKFMLEPLRNSHNYAWVNLFAPTEILHVLDIHPMVIEAFSSFSSGINCEDAFIDYAEKAGISETLCGYHKAFIGAVLSKVLPKPKFALTSTMICDANVNTFRYVSNIYKMPCLILDIPYEYSLEAEDYVVQQLKEAVKSIEDCTNKVLDEDKLKEVLSRENSTKEYMQKYLSSLKYRHLPSTLTLQLFMLFTSHTFMGRKETLKFYRLLAEDMEKCQRKTGIRILWVHVIPYYNEPLKKYFDFNENYQFITYDIPFDNMEYMDFNHPYEALAKKMINNKLNGRYERKLEFIMDMVDKLKPDGVINFSHWGCRQSSGGVMLLKDAMKSRNIPFLSIDGDGVDKRSSQTGQIRTRLEAFFEMIDKSKVIL